MTPTDLAIAAAIAASGVAVAAIAIQRSGADIRRFIPILAAVAAAGMGVAVVIPTLMAGDSLNAVLLSLAAATTVLGTIGAVRSRPGWLAASLLTAAAIGAIVFIVLVVGTLAGSPGDA